MIRPNASWVEARLAGRPTRSVAGTGTGALAWASVRPAKGDTKGAQYMNGGYDDDRIVGSGLTDVLQGNIGEDRIFGHGGDDVLRGGGSDDLLRGDGGDDSLFGEQNADELHGSEGDDELTGGEGPEKCIDAIGMEAHVTPLQPDTVYDRAKQMLGAESDRPHVLREMIYVCRPAGVISIPGVYGGLVDKIPMGQVMNKGLTIRTGQTHVNRWTDDLLRRIEEG